MPTKRTQRRGSRKAGGSLGGTRHYSKGSQRKVQKAMHEMKRGKLHSGRSGKQVTNPRQAIAIGLSEARARGERVPSASSSRHSHSSSRHSVQGRKRSH